MSKVPYSQQKEARQQNTSALLRDLWVHSPLSKAMLAQRNGLTKATVSSICSDLAALGLIRKAGQDRTGLGRPGNLIELNPSARCAIGVEISTNYSAVVLTDLCGQALWQSSALTAVGSNRETTLAKAEALIAEAIEQAREHAAPLLGIGVAVPGVVNGLVKAPALGWKEVDLRQIWEQRFYLPVVVENKARAAAMAEALRGCAQGVASFVYVSVGTDVQSSIEAAVVTDGYPYRGARGMAVDAGHMILDPEGPLCSCGQRGCWEAMVDVDREVELVRTRLASGEASILQRFAGNGGEALDHRAIHQAAVERDPLALEVAGEVLMNHALGITNLVRLFDPELVVIGHANLALPPPYKARMQIMSDMPEFDIPGAVRQQLARRGVSPPAIVHATLGPQAYMQGAAALLVDEFLRTPPAFEGAG
jgi:N-acetylglucosamine repressor